MDELENYGQLPSTSDAEILAAVTKERDEEKVFQFLIGLNDMLYGIIRSNITQ